MRILFISANPDFTPRLDIEDEIRQLKRGLKGKQYDLKMLPAAQPDDLRDFVDSDKADIDIVHFSGHATRRDGLLFRQENGQKEPISWSVLNEIFSGKSIKLAVLNACSTKTTADGIIVRKTDKVKADEGKTDKGKTDKGTIGFADTVISTRKKLAEVTAKKMTKVLYAALGNGKSVDKSFADATQAITESGLDDVYVKEKTPLESKTAEIKFEEGEADVDPEQKDSWDRYFYESYLKQQIESLAKTIERDRLWTWGLVAAGVLIAALLIARYSLDLRAIFFFWRDLDPDARRVAYEDWVSFSGKHMLESITGFGNVLPAMFAAMKARLVIEGKTELRSLTQLLELVKSSAEMEPNLRHKLFSIVEQNVLGAVPVTNRQLEKEEGIK